MRGHAGWWSTIVWLAAGPGALVAGAGPHANGILLTHANPSIEYTTTQLSYEGMADLDDCEGAIVEGVVAPQRAQVWFVLASFHLSPGPVDLGAAAFGFGDYDASCIQFAGYGPCNDGYLELPTSTWPGPGAGTAVLFSAARREEVVEIYWLASYVYRSVSVPLTARPEAPAESGEFAAIPHGDELAEDEAQDYGVMGFGVPGYNPCGGSAEGACCLFDSCRILAREECRTQGGEYLGDNTDCFPNPCEEVPYVETSWGVLKRLYE